MNDKASFTLRGRNPDVLTCIANLSNDEVFTPPEFANRMLDTLAEGWAASNDGKSIWADSSTRFLDPFTKSGVFLREIATRLIVGLKDQIPDLQERVDHILTKQIFGIGITQLTCLLARRSLYCSKYANGEHSVARSFHDESGNIWFEQTSHTWAGERCHFCGASRDVVDKRGDRESHAYALIHSNDVKARVAEMFGVEMQFDVIVGNPPYQLKDGGHQASATPIYQKFIDAAFGLDPNYVVMVTPSRWFQGGRGLDEFRARMLSDKRLRYIVDYIKESDAFPNINVNGGVNYFLWDRSYNGNCTVTTVESGGIEGLPVERPLGEFDVFVRRNQAIPILRKVRALGEPSFSCSVSALKPFGLRTNFHGQAVKKFGFDIKLYGSGKVTWVSKQQLGSNVEWVERWKVLIAAATDGNETYPLPIWDQKGPFVAGPGEACTETYLVAYLASNEEEAIYARNYMRTKFFRFLVSLRKIAQHNKSDNFAFVPLIPLNRNWKDDDLYKRYGIEESESNFIDSLIRSVTWRE